jgi:seryl-tRNA synthetase
MLDLKFFRENPEVVRQAIAKKKFDCDIDAILELDKKRRTAVTEAEALRSQQKAANAEMAKLPKGSPEFLEKVKEMKSLSSKVKELAAQQAEVDEAFKAAFLTIPNMPHESVPVGKNEDENVVFKTWGSTDSVSEFAIPHYDIPWFSDLIDLARGTKVTGAGFPFFKGDIARLVRSLLQFFLDENTAAGYVEVMPPILVNPESATAVGQLPDKEGQMYYCPQDDFYLIPTAETSVTNLYRDEVLELKDLPLAHTAYTPCFRREAGSYGKEVRGLNRVHQFDKVELLRWVHPKNSFEELDGLRSHAESLLEKLGLHYRTLLMCTGDIGFPHAKQFDLEVWAGGQKRWLEVSSCSCFSDFQARRANIRFRNEEGKLEHVHTLNGSGLAIPRVLAAILENNLTEDNRVKVPEVLQERVGKEYIGG